MTLGRIGHLSKELEQSEDSEEAVLYDEVFEVGNGDNGS